MPTRPLGTITALCWINTKVWGRQTGQSAPYRLISLPIVPFHITIRFKMTQANTYCYATLAYVSSGNEPTTAWKQCHLFWCKTQLSGGFDTFILCEHCRRSTPQESRCFAPLIVGCVYVICNTLTEVQLFSQHILPVENIMEYWECQPNLCFFFEIFRFLIPYSRPPPFFFNRHLRPHYHILSHLMRQH